MADDELAIASPALETPASEDNELDTPEIDADALEADAEAEGGPDDEDEGEEETDELDFAFKKYQVPKSLKEAVENLRADATRKTQEASATKKALDARAAEIEESSKVSDAELDMRAELKGVSKTLDEYSKLTDADWAAHESSDPMGTQRAWRQYQMLRDQKAELEGKLGKAQAERTEKAQSDLTKRVQETLEHARNNKSGLKPETIPKLVEFAETLGVPEEAIKRNWSPIFADLLHFARIGKMAAEKQKTAPRRPATPNEPKPIVPVAPRGAAPKTGLRDDLSANEWLKRREAQIAARR